MYIENSSVFDSLFNELQDIIKNVETPIKILEVGAKEFVNDLLKLTKPYSKISASDYTHLVDTFSYEIVKNEIGICRRQKRRSQRETISSVPIPKFFSTDL